MTLAPDRIGEPVTCYRRAPFSTRQLLFLNMKNIPRASKISPPSFVHRWLLRATAPVLLSIFHLHSIAQGVKLLMPISEQDITPEAAKRLAKFRANPLLTNVTVVRLDIAALASEWISLSLPNGQIIQINQDSRLTSRENDSGWMGSIRKGGGSVVFSVTDGSVRGHVGYGAEQYTIRQLGGDIYVIAELVRRWINFGDDAIEPPNEPDEPTQGIAPITSPAGAPMFTSRTGETAAVPVVRILVAYTELAAAEFPNGDDADNRKRSHL
jgi:hypothetical protein